MTKIPIGYYLTEEDASAFKSLIERERKRLHGEGISDSNTHLDGPTCYVAKVPEDGIPALTDLEPSGTSTFDPYPVPGSALCDIYKPTQNNVSGIYELIRVEGFQLTVYNTSNLLIPGVPTRYIVIKKEAYGRWVYECPCHGGFVAYTTSAITAATDAGAVRTVGSGTCTAYKRNTTTNELEIIPGMEDVAIYNSTIQTVGDEAWIQYKIDSFGDLWWDVAECP